MLWAENRLKNKRDFDKVFRKGKAFHSPLFILRVMGNNLPVTRLGFAIGTKINKRAVVRNKLRRRLREILRRELLPRMVQGVDIVVIAKPGAEKLDFAALREFIGGFIEYAGLITGSIHDKK